MRHRGTLAASVLLTAGLLATAGPGSAIASTHSHHKGTEIASVKTKKLGRVVSNSKGRVMYIFSHDGHKVSHCSGVCATAWPKVKSTSKPRAEDGISAKHLSRTKKGQVTYYGHPLYYFASSTKKGSTSGENVAGFFVLSTHGKVVKPKKKTKPKGPTGPAEISTGSVKSTTVLTNGAGRTVYALFDPSETTSSLDCTGACLGVWLPVLTKGTPTSGGSANAAMIGTFTRSGVGTQVTYNGLPLYTYSGDSKSGQGTGEGVFGPKYPPTFQYWYDVTPAGAPNV